MPTLRVLLLALGLGASVVLAQDLAWPELVRRPEFWPTHAIIKESIRLPGQNSLISGQRVAVVAVREAEVVIETPDGRGKIAVKPEKTDVLASARDAWRRLSPEQRALTYADLLQRRDLWPYRVKLLRTVRLNAGELGSGESVVLKDVEAGNLLLASPGARALFTLPPAQTDLLETARQRLQFPNLAPGRITEDLIGKLINPQTGAPATLDLRQEPRLYAFYRGAAGSGPCRQFAAELLKFYQAEKPRRAQFEVIYISGDRSAAELRAYAVQAGFSWRTVVAARQAELQLINRLFTDFIPQLVVTDRQGSVLIHSAKIGLEEALAQLRVLVEKG